MIFFPVLDLYSEKHAKDALSRKKRGSARSSDDEVVLTHAGALYNTDISTERPLVSKLVCKFVHE